MCFLQKNLFRWINRASVGPIFDRNENVNNTSFKT